MILSLSVISYTQAQQQQIEEQIEHSTQHTVEIQPHYYQFQSIGTNNLPPGIEGVFVGRPLRSPTPFPQRLTQSEYLFCQITLQNFVKSPFFPFFLIFFFFFQLVRRHFQQMLWRQFQGGL